MRLKGFTLAEVLIAISIIGVVAAVTLPALDVNSRTREYETAFAKASRDLVNVNQIIMSERSMDNLRAACGISGNNAATVNNTYLSCISNVYGLVPGINPAVTYTNLPAGESGAIAANNANYYSLRNGNFSFWPRNTDATSKYGLMQLFVDLNGPSKGPNRLANDLHILLIDRTGGVYGYGSEMVSMFSSTGDKYSHRSALYCNANSITAAKACSGSITDNGGRILYKLP